MCTAAGRGRYVASSSPSSLSLSTKTTKVSATSWLVLAAYACCCCLFWPPYANGHVVSSRNDYTEQDSQFWIENAQKTVAEKLNYVNNKKVAKNVIMFLGDGMSLTTLTAARIYQGQLEKRTGENEFLSFEKFPFIGMSKTYCVNKQVPDSACTATAYLTGVKGNFETVGLSAKAKISDCPASADPDNRSSSILKWAQMAGKSTGVVTTTRVTHASPSGTYAHSAHRNWESDVDLAEAISSTDITKCEDIAKQLITREPGKNINVILGGGQNKFFLKESDKEGSRMDMDLVEYWKSDKKNRSSSAYYIEDREQLLKIDPSKTDYLLGLFEKEHLNYRLQAKETQPTLAEMTKVAIQMLSKNKNGFFLFVEGGLIDLAHHATMARLALDETIEFSKAVQQAVDLTKEEDTLIIVTSDHAHTVSMAGYPNRGNDILGFADTSSVDNRPYTTVSYANGPKYNTTNSDCSRQNLTETELSDIKFQYPHLIPLKDETHSGEDVMVFARGPWSHLFAGNYEQNVIPIAMGFAAGIGPSGGSNPTLKNDGYSVTLSSNRCLFAPLSLIIAYYFR